MFLSPKTKNGIKFSQHAAYFIKLFMPQVTFTTISFVHLAIRMLGRK